MKVKLSNGMVALIDKSDWEKVKHLTWGFGYGCSYKTGYTPYVGANKKTGGSILLHRFIMDTPKGLHTDHINGDHLDNRRKNLRICTPAENQFNSRKHKTQTSKYKGVSWYKRDACWRAYVNFSRRQIHLGYFADEVAAARVYNEKAKEIYGDFAYLNKC